MTTLTAVQDHLGVWIPQVQGFYINEDWEPVTEGYGAQCWDLAAHWSKFLGLPVINTGGDGGRWPGWAGNMVDCFPQTAEIAAAYELIGPDQPGEPGDIPVWGDSYDWYPKTHVAVLVRDTRNGWLTCMSQNSTPSRGDNPYPNWSTGPTTLQTLPKAGLIGFIRPRTGINYQDATITPVQEDDDMAQVPQEQWDEIRALVKEIAARPEPLVVFKRPSSPTCYLGNGMEYREIKSLDTLYGIQWAARNGWLSVRKNGQVQIFDDVYILGIDAYAKVK